MEVLQTPRQPVAPRPSLLSPALGSLLQRKCLCGGSPGMNGECEECRKKQSAQLQRRAVGQAEPVTVPPIVHDVLRSPGKALDAATRGFFEPRFSHDFSRIRVHTDGQAADSARAVSARAYTVGQDVVFATGHYAPETNAGRKLLAHELAHAVQQSRATNPTHTVVMGDAQDGYEREAAQAEAAALANGNLTAVQTVATPRVQRSILDSFGCTRLPDPDTGAIKCVSLPDSTGCESRGGTCREHGPGGVAGCWCELPSPPLPSATPGGPGPAPGPGALPPQAPPAPAPPAVAAVAPVQRVTGLTVANQAAAITYEEPSILGAAGRKHFVTVAGTGPEVIVEATLTPGGTPATGSVAWVGATPDPGNPARATVPRDRAGKHEVTASAGGASASLTVWAVFASIARVDGPTLGFSPPSAAPAGSGCTAGPAAGQLCVWATTNNDAEIFPKEIITDPDRPNLAGASSVAPPGGLHPCGGALAGGAPLKWDFSRQVNFAFGGILAGTCGGAAGFPANNAEGNDDSHAMDEMNDPYAGGAIPLNGRAVAAGFVGDYDAPSFGRSDAADGVPGDRATLVSVFREFVRLEYHKTWWLISHRPTWQVNFALLKNAAGHWVDDGSHAQ